MPAPKALRVGQRSDVALRKEFKIHFSGKMLVPSQTHGGRPQGPRWSRDQIRAARIALLVPLLQKRGLQLIAREAGNFELPAHPGLIIKESYWPWPQRNLAGNTIDFIVQVLGLTFHNAMREITAA